MKIGPGAALTSLEAYLLTLFEAEKIFSVKDNLLFSSQQTRYFVFDPTAYVPPASGAGRMIGFFPVFSAEAGPLVIDYFIDPDVSDDGTPLSLFNRSDGTIIAQSTFKADPGTVNDEGTKFSGDLAAASASGSGLTAPSATEDALPFRIDYTRKMLIKVFNKNGNDTDAAIKFSFVEL